MKKITIICVIIALVAVVYNKTCKAESIDLPVESTQELSQAFSDLAAIDWVELDKQAIDLVNRADDMLFRLEERIARIEKFQKEHGHK